MTRPPPTAKTIGVPRVATFLFLSGACALVYQVAWFRELRLIFGASTSASAAVLGIFMGGLGLGGLWLGKRADASANPLAMYAKLEMAVAVGAGITPLLVLAADAIYVALGGTTALGVVLATALRVLLSVIVLGPITFLMGGTLPAAARAVSRADDGARRSVATLYGVNTAGAVLGTVLANFLLLEVLGTRMTLWVAALLNLLVGVIANASARGAPVRTAAAEGETLAPEPEPAGDGAIPSWFPPAAAALVGAAFMLMELTWYRMLGPLLGGSSYTFGLILAVALVGIGLGGGIYARSRIPATLKWFAITCALEALFIALPYAVGDDLAVLAGLLRPVSKVSFASTIGVWTVITSFVVFPAAVVSGIQFPLVIGLYGRGSKGVGRDVGIAYLANTAGSLVGSLAGGFGLVPLLGAIGVWKLVVIALAGGAAGASLLAGGTTAAAGPWVTRALRSAVLVALPLLLLLARGPSAVWRHSGIGAGRADQKLENANAAVVAVFENAEKRSIRWEVDGVESTVALNDLNSYSFVVNGKSDGNATRDAPTQVMGGLLAAILHGAPRRSLVVGLGTGSTAGWLGAIPGMERVDVVELEPAILRVARECAPVNQNVLDNPKVHVTIADAREQLRTTRETYDLIFSEPSNPYRAGISSLYTVEYYRAAGQRLAPGGFFVQWIQAYEVDGWVIATALTTLRQVFGDVDIWQTMDGDLFLVARREHTPFEADRLRATIAQEPYASALRQVWHTDKVEGFLSHFLARSALADRLIEAHEGAVNTDDQNLLEFAFARNLGSRRRVDADLVRLAERLGLATADVRGAVDGARVREETWLFQHSEGLAYDPPLPRGPAPGLARVLQAADAKDLAGVTRIWTSLHREEIASSGERELVAEAASRAGADEAPALIARAPEETRDLLGAYYASSKHDDAAAAVGLVRTFERARTYPWFRPTTLEQAVSFADELAARSPAQAPVLFDALARPFAVERAREERQVMRARISVHVAAPAACVEAFDALDPPPWHENILLLRTGCYVRANSPKAEQAERDLLELRRTEPTPLGASLARAPAAPPAPSP